MGYLMWILDSNTVVLCDCAQVVPWVSCFSTLLETLTYNHTEETAGTPFDHFLIQIDLWAKFVQLMNSKWHVRSRSEPGNGSPALILEFLAEGDRYKGVRLDARPTVASGGDGIV